MKKILILGVAAAITLSGSPAVAQNFDWTGFYAGGHLGGAWSKEKWVFAATTINASPDPNGFLGGLQAGYNFQSGLWVFGVEADASWADVKGSGLFSEIVPGPDGFGRSKIDFLATLTGRIGFAAWQQGLIYVKGGAAWADEKYWQFSDPITTPKVSKTLTGWIIGAGVEQAWTNNWSVKLEYNYIDFGTTHVFIPVFDDPETVREKVHVVKLGLNYKFGAPVSTKY